MANEPSPSLFAMADSAAARTGDVIILFARVVLGWLFLATAWSGLMNVAGSRAYLTSLGVPAADVMVWLTLLGELGIGSGLILGIATRYVALSTFVFLIMTVWLGHRYWTYPVAQQAGQYAHFLKNLALMGGALMLFWSGAGRYSVDARLR